VQRVGCMCSFANRTPRRMRRMPFAMPERPCPTPPRRVHPRHPRAVSRRLPGHPQVHRPPPHLRGDTASLRHRCNRPVRAARSPRTLRFHARPLAALTSACAFCFEKRSWARGLAPRTLRAREGWHLVTRSNAPARRRVRYKRTDRTRGVYDAITAAHVRRSGSFRPTPDGVPMVPRG
jgi:hypothetical protein